MSQERNTRERPTTRATTSSVVSGTQEPSGTERLPDAPPPGVSLEVQSYLDSRFHTFTDELARLIQPLVDDLQQRRDTPTVSSGPQTDVPVVSLQPESQPDSQQTLPLASLRPPVAGEQPGRSTKGRTPSAPRQRRQKGQSTIQFLRRLSHPPSDLTPHHVSGPPPPRPVDVQAESSDGTDSENEQREVNPQRSRERRPISNRNFERYFDEVYNTALNSSSRNSRDMRELDVLQCFTEVWDKLSEDSQAIVLHRIQLFDLVGRYGWAAAVKLHPDQPTMSNLAAKVDPALLLHTLQTQGRRDAGPSRDAGGRFQRGGGKPPQQQQQQQQHHGTTMNGLAIRI